MKKTKIKALTLLAAAMMVVTMDSCRQASDEIVSNNGLGKNDIDAKRYTELWDVMWNGFNTNYPAWELETIDWDEQYTTTHNKLAEIDKEYDDLLADSLKSDISTDTAAIAKKALQVFKETFAQLHDGHTRVEYLDRATQIRKMVRMGTAYRTQRENPMAEKSIWDTRYYYASGEVDTARCWMVSPACTVMKRLTGLLPDMQKELAELTSSPDKPHAAMTEYIDELRYMTELLSQVRKDSCMNTLRTLYSSYTKKLANGNLKALASKYDLPSIPLNDSRASDMEMFFTKDNIAYYRLSLFDIPMSSTVIPQNEDDKAWMKRYQEAVEQWHSKVYELHKNGQLKGVVLDVRNNTGGVTLNMAWFVGLLLKGDKFSIGTYKKKNGIGRLDYSAPMDINTLCCGWNSEDITEPVVVLTNGSSVSCAEASTITARQMPNAISLGTCTYGAGNALVGTDPTANSLVGYSGCIGIRNVTPVYAYIPCSVLCYNGFGSIESLGIEPNIKLEYDKNLYSSSLRDNQLERAFSYIREGK